MFKINYLIPSNKNNVLLGKICFLKEYLQPSISFPFFYLNSQNETLNYANWPNLVPYLYEKTLGFFTTVNNNYRFKDTFSVYSFSLTTINQIILKFTDPDSVKALRALDEDRKLYFIENNNYTDWYRTFTPLNDFRTADNNVFLFSGLNYRIDSINIQSNNLATITATISNNVIYNEEQIATNRNIQFGLYRIVGKNSNEAVIYNYIENKHFCTSNSNDLIGGLRVRSQIIGHAHEHTHTQNHTHNLSHTHDLRDHVHYMNHQHGYSDSTSNNVGFGNGAGTFVPGSTPQTLTYRITNFTGEDYTAKPNINSTGNPNQLITSVPNNNNLTGISAKTINNDGGLFTNSTKFKHGDKNNYDSTVYYAYIFGGSYIVT